MEHENKFSMMTREQRRFIDQMWLPAMADSVPSDVTNDLRLNHRENTFTVIQFRCFPRAVLDTAEKALANLMLGWVDDTDLDTLHDEMSSCAAAYSSVNELPGKPSVDLF